MRESDPPAPDVTEPDAEPPGDEPDADESKKKTAKKKKSESATGRRKRIKRRVSRLPQTPGVYLMRDKVGEVFYVGKASNLRARVRSYFDATSDARSFVALLDRILFKLDFIVTAHEKEALLLENNLIKEHRPRYNVKLRDDKNYLALRLDTRQDFPRLELVRRIKADGARYFGPYHSARAARSLTRLLNKHFQLRVCTDRVMKTRKRPCLQHQIGRCLAPCTLEVDPALYGERVADVILFLAGREDELLKSLEARMFAAAAREAFEEAARLRDLNADLTGLISEQHVVEAVGVNQDVLGYHREGDRVEVCLMTIRRGRLVGTEQRLLRKQEFPDGELVSSFLAQRYDGDRPLPDEILVPLSLEDADVLGDWLSEKRGRKVRVIRPQRGYRRRLLDLALRNAQASYASRATRTADTEERLARMQKRLRLGRLPRRIEGYDISNFAGKQTVGSMVVMLDGEPANKAYRHFRLKDAQGQGHGPDDYASLRELLERRFARAQSGDADWEAPDLVVIDGGKGQLNTVLTVLADLGVPHGAGEMDVVSLAKERSTWDRDTAVVKASLSATADSNPDGASLAADSAEEAGDIVDRVFLPGEKDPIRLRANTAELFMLARLRDEAHRFAITHHRKLRKKATLRTSLEDVPGVGPKRAKALLKHFGSVKGVKAATAEDLQNAPGMSRSLALKLLESLSAGDEPPAKD